jgi:deoxyribodipyrimidine photolyase-related protein
MATKILRLILGDQLNSQHSWFSMTDDAVTYVMMEVRTETDYAQHHIQKVVGFFAAMRDFAVGLQAMKHKVIYLKLTDKNNLQSFEANLEDILKHGNYTQFEYQLPDEYRLDLILKNLRQFE